MRGLCPDPTVYNVLSGCDSLVGQAAELLDKRTDVRLLGQNLCLHLLKNSGRLIIKRRCFINGSAGQFYKRKLPLERSYGFFSRLLRHLRIKTIKSKLAVKSVFIDTDDVSPLRHHRRVADRLGPL